jgi:hypothetical protein
VHVLYLGATAAAGLKFLLQLPGHPGYRGYCPGWVDPDYSILTPPSIVIKQNYIL